MSPSHNLRRASSEAARRRRLADIGVPGRAMVLGVRSTGRLDGTAPLLELDLEVEDPGGGPSCHVTVVQAVPLVLSARVSPGAWLEVLVDVTTGDAVVEWSA
jgi:hypothetical protein